MTKHSVLAFLLLFFSMGAVAQDVVEGWQAELRAARLAYEAVEDNESASDSDLARATFDYGFALMRASKLDEGRETLKLALKRYKRAFGKDSPEQIRVLLQLAQAEYALGKSRSSQRYLENARSIATESFGNSSIEYADILYRIGRIELAMGSTDAAYDNLMTAHQIYETALDPTAPRLGESNQVLGELCLRTGRLKMAETYLLAALEIFDPSKPDRLGAHIDVLAGWGGVLDSMGLRNAATEHYLAIGRLLEPNTTDLLPAKRVAPMFPMDALEAGISGYVEWQFTVDENGFVVDPQVIDMRGAKSFEAASWAALSEFRYPPRFVDGQPVATPGVTTIISFMIED